MPAEPVAAGGGLGTDHCLLRRGGALIGGRQSQDLAPRPAQEGIKTPCRKPVQRLAKRGRFRGLMYKLVTSGGLKADPYLRRFVLNLLSHSQLRRKLGRQPDGKPLIGAGRAAESWLWCRREASGQQLLPSLVSTRREGEILGANQPCVVRHQLQQRADSFKPTIHRRFPQKVGQASTVIVP